MNLNEIIEELDELIVLHKKNGNNHDDWGVKNSEYASMNAYKHVKKMLLEIEEEV